MTQSKIRSYPVPDNEQERLAALYAYDILDSGPEPGFDRSAILASRLFRAPIALVSLVDDERQWFKAKCGLTVNETSRDLSFCTYAMLERAPMVVCDATADDRFRENSLVTGDLSIRFYVGAPILSGKGLPLGTLCIIDHVVRERPAQHLLDSLMDLAYLVGELFEFRAAFAVKSAIEKRHHEQLKRATQEALAASRAKGDFLARMSHEIRTPMNLIMGMNALLLDSPLNEKQRQRVEISHRNVRRLLRLINGILDLSKVEAGELIFQEVPFDLDEVLKECAGTISTAIEQNGLAFEVFIDLNAWRYWVGDPERLQQVLLNLIGNAIKFTSAGKIAVRVAADVSPQGEPGLRVEITDTGCGIPKDKAHAIFEAFHQVEESMSRSYEGTGLGLSISKTLVERMSGKIWLGESNEAGSKFVFTVFLPAATEQAVRSRGSAEIPTQMPEGWADGARILLVEDNPENVILIQAYLENLSLSIDFAANGLEALEKRQHADFDLILMDIQMPVMDGYTATRRIRSWEQAKNVKRVPIVALTAHAFSGAAADSVDAGCDWHLTKPVERRDLLEAIARFACPSEPEVEEEVSDGIRAHRPVYLAKRRSELDKMREALAASDFAFIQSVGHNCKGTGTGFGFPEISSIGLEIERAAKALDRGKLGECLLQFEQFVVSASKTG